MEIEVLKPGHFESDRHYYPRTLNAQIHPLVLAFMRMSRGRLVSRYCHLNPHVDRDALEDVLTTAPRFLRWSGSDVLNVSTEDGRKRKLVVETNSCPSGQKSFPVLEDDREEGGYARMMEHTFVPLISKVLRKAPPEHVLTVLYDKNHMESSGYAQVLANATGREVLLVPCLESDPHRFLEIHDRRLFVRHEGQTVEVACAFRYVTQKPWTRLPFNLRTPILNPIVACLAGGRNKTTAAKAYEMLNGKLRESGLQIHFPETHTNVGKREVPLLAAQFGGRLVVKVPYLNAGQGIYTIVNQRELDAFMAEDHPYEEFVVQQLVGGLHWSSTCQTGKLFHIGTIPDKSERIYAFDMRMMISWQESEFRPLAMYARRAQLPLLNDLEEGSQSWSILGTNLSKRLGVDSWTTEPTRLLMVDRKDFGRLGLGMDDLIDTFVQTVLCHRAIDDLSQQLVMRGGGFRRKLFATLTPDASLLDEIREDLPQKREGAGSSSTTIESPLS